jgi:hypothetical protein
MADSAEFSAFSQRELRSLAKTFDLMGERAVEKSKATAFDIASQPQAMAEQSITKVSAELSMVHQSLELQKQGAYLMVSLVSVFQVGAAPRYSGAVLNLVQRNLSSSQPLAADLEKGLEAISYFQPFAKFSLN